MKSDIHLRPGLFHLRDNAYGYHSQILNCTQGIVSASPVFYVRNALFNNVTVIFDTSAAGITGHCEHLTVK